MLHSTITQYAKNVPYAAGEPQRIHIAQSEQSCNHI